MNLLILIALGQLVDAYFRWLAFSKTESLIIKRKIFIRSALWSVLSVFLYISLFKTFGINATTYKAALMLGWLPYFFICLREIPGLYKHIFVLGMGTICSMVQHTISAIIFLKFDLRNDYDIILMDAAGYLLLFVISLPALSKYFINLLPSCEFFDSSPMGIYIAILPFLIVSVNIFRIADDTLVHSDIERFSRIYLPVVFFFFYRYILLAAQNFYDLQRLERSKTALEEKLVALKEYNALSEENQKKISVMRHDLRHSYNLIYAMLENGDVEAAREHIRKQKEWLK